MKVSKKQKEDTKRAIIRAAVDIMSKEGFERASMREISQAAGVGDATIYNYFSTKEKLLYGFVEQVQTDVFAELATIDGFDSFSLKEKVHMLMESILIQYLPSREFVAILFQHVYQNPMICMHSLKSIRDTYHEKVHEWILEAVAADELKDQPMLSWISGHFWEYGTGIIWYWLHDDSDQFEQTTQLLDMTLDLIMQFIQSNILGHVSDVASFLIKAHIFKYFDSKPSCGLLKTVMGALKPGQKGGLS